MTDYSVINILDLLDLYGENRVNAVLSGFSCPKNREIENFLLKNAVEFSKRKMSITHLVLDDHQQFIGYFTLTHKSSLIPVDKLSKTGQKKLAMHGRFDEASNCYDVSAFLVAQFGKNYSVQNGTAISGNHLMEYVFRTLFKAQQLIGGGVVFLECEEKDKLLDFYQNDNNRFKLYGERFSEREQKKYLQLLRFF
ncbi:MAG: GNAT family acetyltransferase [Oscillospiraceae bacterium]|nr:GNAT family acetyltransferase [Oscillospiraceae bacterium]